MSMPNGRIVLCSGLEDGLPTPWLKIQGNGDRLAATEPTRDTATVFMAEPLDEVNQIFALKPASQDGLWLSRIHRDKIDCIEAKKKEIDPHCHFGYQELPSGLFRVSCDDGLFWRVDIQDGKLIKAGEIDSQGDKALLFSWKAA
jgi:hypothetical protein